MAFLHGPLGMCTKEIINQMYEMDMDKCIGAMVASIKVSGKMGYKMEKGKFMCLAKGSKKEYFKIMCL